MQVLLRQVKTKLFYVGEGQWSNETEAAKHFGTLAEAKQRATREKLHDIELVMLDKHAHWEAVWPLKEPSAGSRPG